MVSLLQQSLQKARKNYTENHNKVLTIGNYNPIIFPLTGMFRLSLCIRRL
jgi:hypothetical protein